ncbi:MAG: RNA-guided endonuclease TnpB family protein [Candidatus Poribacteria bacterium]|nr:RNA-guided endonuclease TnpB family protein [Candidatus Poribacteria bacterium]
MAHKAHKIALRPTDAQVAWFQQQCGYARFAFNLALADFKAGLSEGMFHSFINLNNRWNQRKKALDWAGEQDQRAALHGVKNLSDAVTRWRKKQNRFPKFKKRGSRQSYTVEGYQCKVEGKHIKLPKIGTVKMFSELRFAGKIKQVTISRSAHRWFVSILVDTGTPNVPRDTRGLPVIGIDVGINTLATLDNGKQYENPRPLKRYERKLAREQRKLSRKVFLSQNWYKQKRKVERLHYRIACIRKDAHHKVTTDIVRKASAIGIETLSVTNLLKNRKLAKALSDSALGGFLEKLKTKAEGLGIPIVQAPQFFASSKMCSSCGHKKDDLTLSDRNYQCNHCGTSIDRDQNAAINLKQVAVGYTET